MATHLSTSELRRRRLLAQGLTERRVFESPEAVVQRLFALQAQDLPGVLWSLGLRSGLSAVEVRAAFDNRHLVRSWPLRGTLHVTAAADLRTLLAVTGPRLQTGLATRRRQLGLDSATLARARKAAEGHLTVHASATRGELLAAFTAAGVIIEGQRGYHLLAALAIDGVLVQGPFRGTEQLFVLADDWLPPAGPVDPEEAVVGIVERYLRGHGPASIADLGSWTKLPLRPLRSALAELTERLTQFDHNGTTLWALDEAPPNLAEVRAVVALPGFDEYILGYADRTAAVRPEHAAAIVPGGNGVFRPTLVQNGEVIATWTRKSTSRSTSILVQPLDGPLPAEVLEGIGRLEAEYGAFLASPVSLTIAAPRR